MNTKVSPTLVFIYLIVNNEKIILIINLNFGDHFGSPNSNINGQVLVQENNETYPLEGVSIFWLDTQEGTVSNAQGAFTLDRVPNTDQLVLKYLGFKTDTLTVSSDKKIIPLHERRFG